LKADISSKISGLKADGKPLHFFEKVKLHPLEAIHAYASECGFERIKSGEIIS